MNKALIIEDDPQIAELISIHLRDLNFDVSHAGDGLDGLRMALDNQYDIFILDLMLPSIDGMDICKKIRSRDTQTPVIMLTARSEEIDRVLGLETGADDYIVKPFSVREFKARVKAVLRRSHSSPLALLERKSRMEFGELVIDTDKRIVEKNGERIDLTPKEFELLATLASHPGKSFNRQRILNMVWGYDFKGFEHTVNSHINRLRAKIEDNMTDPQYVLTSWGYGYRFNDHL